MKLKYITIAIPILILIFYFISVGKRGKEATEYIEQIALFEEANNVIINHLEKICTGGCLSMNRYYFEQTILKKNEAIKQDLQSIVKLWDTNLLSSVVTEGYITVQPDTVISYQVALFKENLFSNAYIHEIIYDPKDGYKENFVDGGWKVIHVKQIKPYWKYLIIEDILDD